MAAMQSSSKYSLGTGTSHRTAMERVRNELLMWICEKHATNGELSRDLLRRKALELSEEFRLIDFKASGTWVTSFLKKYGFSTSLTSCDGPIFKDYRTWIGLLRPVIERYKYDDLFHAEEFCMYSNVLPSSVVSIITNGVHHEDNKTKHDPITILLCCNASGMETLPPVICGSKSLDSPRNDCTYISDENSQISDEVFAAWLLKLNERLIRDQRRILLLMHRSRIRASGDVRLSNIQLLFFPKEFPPQLRPLQGEIFHYVKTIYRQQYANITSGLQLHWNVDKTIDMLLYAWTKLPRELIISSFQRTTFRCDNCFLQSSNPDFWDDLEADVSFRKFIDFDDELSNEISRCRMDDANRPQVKYDLRSRCKKPTVIYLDSESPAPSPREENEKANCAVRHSNSEWTKESGDNGASKDSPRDVALPRMVIHEIDIDYPDHSTPEFIPSSVRCDNSKGTSHSTPLVLEAVEKSREESLESGKVSKEINPESSLLFGDNFANYAHGDEDNEGISSCHIELNNSEPMPLADGQGDSVDGLIFGKRKYRESNEEIGGDDKGMKAETGEDKIESGAKKQRIESNWYSKFEKEFVFGLNDSKDKDPGDEIADSSEQFQGTGDDDEIDKSAFAFRGCSSSTGNPSCSWKS